MMNIRMMKDFIMYLVVFVGIFAMTMVDMGFRIQVQGASVERLSFHKPFETISFDGNRQIDGKWSIGGHTQVNKHFVRLTPDRQSKRGHVWAQEPLRLREFSLVFTFRISGQGSQWYGDGLALWLTTSPKHVDGDYHGFQDKYIGVGIIFDTFINSDHHGGHKDVTVSINDGKKSIDHLNYDEKKGCNVPDMRYHEKNAGFSASVNATRAKIQVRGERMIISMDPKNTGEWRPCFDEYITIPGFNWEDAVIGMTASTGSLADNHDVIGLNLYDKVEDEALTVSDELVKEKTTKKVMDPLMGSNEERVLELKKQFDKLQEDFEHQIASLREETQNTIKKLRDQEEQDERQIVELQNIINTQLNRKLSSQMSALENAVDSKLEQKVTEGVNQNSGWKLPFFLLLVGLCAGAFFMYKKYQDLRKSHLL